VNCQIKDCTQESTKGTLWNARYIRVCEDHYGAIFNYYHNKGVSAFYGWMLQMFGGDVDRANATVEQIFGDGEEIQKQLIRPGSYLPMFTFGILKYPENIEYQGGINIVENATVKGHVMYATSGRGFPVTQITGNPDDAISGTYFEMPVDVVLGDFDITEGYSPYTDPSENMYNRNIVQVTLPNGQIKDANMYIANPEWFKTDMIEDYRIRTGNYDDRHGETVWILKRDGEING
jgi:hypothetical protein